MAVVAVVVVVVVVVVCTHTSASASSKGRSLDSPAWPTRAASIRSQCIEVLFDEIKQCFDEGTYLVAAAVVAAAVVLRESEREPPGG